MQVKSRWVPVQGKLRNRLVLSRNNPVIYLANSTCPYCNTYTLPSTLIFRFCHFYRPPTKFWDVTVFSGVCLSLCPQRGSHVTITYDALDLTTQDHCPTPIQGPHQTGTPHYTGTSPYSDHPAHGHQTCLNLFNLDLTVQGLHPNPHPPPPHPPTCSNLFIMKHVARSGHFLVNLLKCSLSVMKTPPHHSNSYNHQSSNNANNHLVCLRTYQILI